MPRREVDTSKAKCRTCGGPWDPDKATYSIANKWDDTVDDRDVLLEFEHWDCHTPFDKALDNLRDAIDRAQHLIDKLKH